MQVKAGAGVSGQRPVSRRSLTSIDIPRVRQHASISSKKLTPEAAPQPARASEDSTHAWFLYGMRLGEIRNLKREQINLQEHTIRLYAGQTKNDEARIIPLKAERF